MTKRGIVIARVDHDFGGISAPAEAKEIVASFFDEKNNMCFFRAGVSLHAGVPTGYHLKEAIRHLTNSGSSSWKDLSTALRNNQAAFQKFRRWFLRVTDVDITSATRPLFAHEWILKRWVAGNFSTVVTTNWDFLLERAWPTVLHETRPSEDLFVCSSAVDLDYAKKMARKYTLYKIHGNPLYYTCPQCRGATRFKYIDPTIDAGRPLLCSIHRAQLRDPAMILPTEEVDSAERQVWEHIRTMARGARRIFVIGYSGSDDYIRADLMKPNKQKLYVVKPVSGEDPIEELVSEERLIDMTAWSFFFFLGIIESDAQERVQYGDGKKWWQE